MTGGGGQPLLPHFHFIGGRTGLDCLSLRAQFIAHSSREPS